eukprot:TRINITY_DN4969_c0_g1_i1.p1 TRINITY_DN4969_c0_g1~~TRINITY_DN4969_c0_g1_i1.p1  ORF type:complete len:172 (+),score=19.58 TRINITY_DN4969_c0_g1_i1:253-768(+)
MFMQCVFAALIIESILIFLFLLPLPIQVTHFLSKLVGKVTATKAGIVAYYIFLGIIVSLAVFNFYSGQRMIDNINSEDKVYVDHETRTALRLRQFRYQRNGYITAFASFNAIVLTFIMKRIERQHSEVTSLKAKIKEKGNNDNKDKDNNDNKDKKENKIVEPVDDKDKKDE